MASLSSIKRPDLVTVTLKFSGETVNVTFDRNAMTQRWVKAAQEGRTAADVEWFSRSLAELLTGWDIVDDQGAPVPITPEVLSDLPLPFLGALDEAIGEAGTLSSEEGNASSPSAPSPSSGSTRELTASPNGSETSTSQNASAVPS